MARKVTPLEQAIKQLWNDLIEQILTFISPTLDNRLDYITEQLISSGVSSKRQPLSHWLNIEATMTLYFFTGFKKPFDLAIAKATDKSVPDLSAEFAAAIRAAMKNPWTNEITETMGVLVTEPVLTLFEHYAGRDDLDPKEFARAFHGFMISLTAVGGAADTMLETLSAGQIEGAGRMLEGIYWNLGLGFLGWQTLAPLLESGLQPGLDRYYRRLYRPNRFSASELRDLYALGRISKETLRKEAANLGWRDQDIDSWIDLSFRALTQGETFDLYHGGFISQDEAIRRLRELGYDPKDIPLLFQINQPDDVISATDLTLSTAKQAFREGLLSETAFKQALENLGKSTLEIQLLVSLQKLNQEQDIKALTVSQIREAWENNELSDAEAAYWLSNNDFASDQIGILLRTWKAELVPEFRKLNKSTIVNAYVEGVLDRSQAQHKLEGIGLSPQDAKLELDLAEASNPEAFGRAQAAPARQLQLTQLADLVETGIITPQELQARMIELGYSERDAQLYTLGVTTQIEEGLRPLSQSTIEDAYLLGVLSREQATAKLLEEDFSLDDANLILNTVEANYPTVFNPAASQSTRQPNSSALIAALQNNIISEAEYYARMAEIGYNTQDAEMFVLLAARQERKRTKYITRADIINAYNTHIFTRGRAKSELMVLGYSEYDADLIMRLEDPGIEGTQAWLDFLARLISAETLAQQLINLGFTDIEIEEALNKYTEAQDSETG